MPGNVVQTTLRYLVDQASIKAALDANSKIAASSRVASITAADVFQQASVKGKSASDVLSSALGRNAVSAKDVTDAYAALEAQILAANSAAKIAATGLDSLTDTQKAAVGAGGGGGGLFDTFKSIKKTGLGMLGSQGRMLPSIQTPLGIGTDQIFSLIRLGGAAQALGVTAAQAAVAVPLVGVALVGMALAVDTFTQSIENSKKTLTGAIGAQDMYYKALGQSTTQQVKDQIDGLKRSQPALKQQIDETQKAIDSAFAQEVALLGGGALGDSLARALDAAGKTPYEQLKKQLEDLNAEYTANDQGATRLTQGLKINAFALNDLAEQADQASKALEAAAKSEEQRRIAATESGIAFTQQIYQLQATGTADELAKAIQQTTMESDALSKSLGYLEKHAGDSDAASQEFLNATDKIRQASEELQHFKLDALDDVITNTQYKLAADIEAINAKEAEAEANALDDKNAKLNAAQVKSDADLVKLAADTADKRAKIERTYARSAAEAIQDRDAVALDRARTKRDDDLKDLKDASAKQRKTIRQGLKDQQDTIELAYQKQLTTARKQAASETALKNAVAQASIQSLYDTLTAEQRLRDQANAAHLAATEFTVRTEKALLAQIAAAARIGTGGVIGSAVGSALGVPGFAQGGMVPRTGLIFAHRGERVLTAQQQRNMGGAGITINGYGMNEEQVVKQVRRALRSYNRGLRAAS